MKIQRALKITGILLILLPAVQLCKAQSNLNWRPLWLSTTGYFKGVEGFYQLSGCNGSDVVFIKLINHNSYEIKASWQDLVNNNSNNHPSSLKIGANLESKGDCTGNNKQLVIKLKDFSISSANFQSLYLKNFDVIEIQ